MKVKNLNKFIKTINKIGWGGAKFFFNLIFEECKRK